MRDQIEVAVSTDACRSCGHTLASSDYYCPECDKPHFPHLKASLSRPMMSMLAFAMVIAGPVAAYTLYVTLMGLAN
jgi:hypothetical protein